MRTISIVWSGHLCTHCIYQGFPYGTLSDHFLLTPDLEWDKTQWNTPSVIYLFALALPKMTGNANSMVVVGRCSLST